MIVDHGIPFASQAFEPWRSLGGLVKRLGVVMVAAFFLVPMRAIAEPLTLRFTELSLDINDVTDEYARFGLTFANVYLYLEARDPFPDPALGGRLGTGLSNGTFGDIFTPGVFGRVRFQRPTPFIQLDWWVLFSGVEESFVVNLFGIDGHHLGAFSSSAEFGSTRLARGTAIASFSFGGPPGGFAGISNLTFDRDTAPVPEPATVVLLGMGAALAFVASGKCSRRVLG